MIRVLLFILVFVKVSISSAQSNEIQFEHLSMKDGLSMNPVMSIIQDRSGYLWFGTQDGLNKYDGYDFVVYKTIDGDSSSLSDNFITCIADDNRGRLWVGTLTGGLSCLQTSSGKFRRFNVAGKHLPNDRIWCVFRDRQERIWSGTAAGPVIIDPKTDNITRASSVYSSLHVLDNLNVLTIFQDQSGKFWIGTTIGVFILDPSADKIERLSHNEDQASLSNDIVLSVYQDSRKNIWVGTVDGLCKYESGKFRNFFFKKTEKGKENRNNHSTIRNIYSIVNNYGGNTIRCVMEDEKGKFWIGTDMELIIFDPVSETYINYKKDIINPMGINDHFIRSMYVDRSKNLWIGTLGSGLNKVNLKPRKFIHYQKNVHGTGLSENYVRSIVEDKDGRILIGTLVGGLNILDPVSNQFSQVTKTAENSPNSINDNNVWSLALDFDGSLWIGTNNGLDRYDPVTRKFRHYLYDKHDPESISENTIRSLLCTEEHVWVGTEGGLNRLDRSTGKFHRFTKGNGLSDNTVWKIIKDRKGDLWAATNDGLNRIDKSGTVSIFRKVMNDSTSLSHNGVRTLFEDANGFIWVGTQNGLNKLDAATGKFQRFFEQHGLPNSFIYGIIGDRSGNLWISTNRGLSRMDHHTGKFTNYDVFDGLQDYEFNTNACFQSKKGEMFFGGPNGLNRFSPVALPLNNFIPPVEITSVKVFDKVQKVSRDEEGKAFIELSFDQNILNFGFASLDFTYPFRNQYQFMMEGFNKEWISSGNTRFTSYTNLDPGEYVFKVKGSNSDGIWSDKTAEIRIIIHPPFWKTNWFYALCVFTALGATYVFFRLRLRALTKEKRILEEKVSERTFALEEEKKKVEAVNAELEKLSIVASETDNAVIIADGEGEIEWVNEGFERIHGSLREFISRSGSSVFSSSSNPELRKNVKESVEANRSFVYESLIERKSGETLYVQSTLTPIVDSEKRLRKIVIIDTDITERKKAEEIITQKNKDITDSINYAKRIQQAILPDLKELYEGVKESFVFYKPKDIVSGDFYWFTRVEDTILFAAADCTGHGVPGAFMSMIGNALLNEIVKEKNIYSPAAILDMLNAGIKAALKQDKSSSDTADGMDIALCSFNRRSMKLIYSGAMRPLYVVSSGELTEYKADKCSIGGRNTGDHKFTENALQLNKGDMIYISTDGYPDQFGGSTGKKLMTKNFKKLLLQISDLPASQQRERLKSFFIEWKGEREQIDDVLVIGARA